MRTVTTYPGTVMVHPTNAPVAYSAMMAKGRFKCLTLTAHAERLVGCAHFTSHAFIRHSRLWDTSRV